MFKLKNIKEFTPQGYWMHDSDWLMNNLRYAIIFQEVHK